MARDRHDDEDHDDDRPRRRRDDDDDFDRPRNSRRRDEDDYDRPPPKSGNGFAIASLVLGLLSLCFGPITGIIGGILGLVSFRKPTGRVMGVIGLVLSFIFSVTWIGVGVWVYLEAQKVRKESNNLKQIGLATHNYHDTYGTMPKAYFDDRGRGNPQPSTDLTAKLSWRVPILPYLEQEKVFRQFKPDEPWDSATNRPLADKVTSQYADVETPADPATRWRCFYDNGAAFLTTGGHSLIGMTDGTANTIMYVEGGDKVTWSRFQEYRYDPKGLLPQLGKPNKPTFLVVMADGSVRHLRKDMNETTLRAMITANGGEVVDLGR